MKIVRENIWSVLLIVAFVKFILKSHIGCYDSHCVALILRILEQLFSCYFPLSQCSFNE